MGKHILVDFDDSGRPFTSESTLHLQQAYQEQVGSILIDMILSSHLIYDNTKVYILYGCVDSIFSSNHNISAGAVFFNGEIYQSDAQVFPVVGGTVVISNLSTTYYSGTNPDPITYKDLSTHSPHQILKIIFSTGATGTGRFNGGAFTSNDLNNFIDIKKWKIFDPLASPTFSPNTGSVSVTATNYNKWRFEGNTFKWQLKVVFDLAGSIDNIEITLPPVLIGKTWAVPNGQFLTAMIDNGGTYIPLIIEFLPSPFCINIYTVSGSSFSNATGQILTLFVESELV